LRLTERRFQAGDVAELDVRVCFGGSATESDALALDRSRRRTRTRARVLIGPGGFALSTRAGRMERRLPLLPPGVPSTVLARRPDLSAASAPLLAAQARVGVAQAAWFPT